MLTKPQVMLLAGLLLLFAAAALTYLLQRARAGKALFTRRACRLRLPGGLLRLLRQCLQLPGNTPELASLHHSGQRLTESLLLLERTLKACSPLPGDREPRLMLLARRLVQEDRITAAALTEELASWDGGDLSSRERRTLPLVMSAAVCERLTDALHALMQDHRDRLYALRLCSRLMHSRSPLTVLSSQQLSLTALSALLKELRSRKQTMLLGLIADWLRGHGTDPESIAERHTRRQTAIADDIRTAGEQLAALRMLAWEDACEQDDPLHLLLSDDPSGLYPRLLPSSRRLLRDRAELLARWLYAGSSAVVEGALHLAREAEENTLEQHVGWYLLEQAGLRDLRRQLAVRKGRIRCFLLTHPRFLRGCFLWCFGVVCGVLFLNAGHPLLMLPFFLIVAGELPRLFLAHRSSPAPVPALRIREEGPALRTMVVLHAVLSSPEDAVRAFRRLKILRLSMRPYAPECLLLADFAPAMTQRKGTDQAIISAAAQAAAALCDESGESCFRYLQRTRTWLADQRIYGSRAGYAGCIETLCRLIAHGECEDYFDHATLRLSDLRRRCEFILAVDEASQPMPGMLSALLSTAAHPFNTRYPTPEGMRGFSCFSAFVDRGAWSAAQPPLLIRPDAYLASTDGKAPVSAPDADGALAAAISGCCTVPDAHAHTEAPDGLWSRESLRCRRAARTLRHAAWLFPWVSAPAGIIRNPLSSDQRARLRGRLRRTLLPLCRCFLLLWALVERDAGLLLIAAAAPEAVMLLLHGRSAIMPALESMLLLPLHAAADGYAVFRAAMSALHRPAPDRLQEPSAWQALALWSQCTASIICFLLGFALPPVWLPALLPAAMYPLYVLLVRRDLTLLSPDAVLPNADHPALKEIAAATWRYFTENGSPALPFLPPARVQTAPSVELPASTTPEALAGCLIAAISAKEIGIIPSDEAARRIAAIHSFLQQLPMVQGLPCRSYSLPDPAVFDPVIEARGTGLLLAAVITSAQALRAWLPQLPPEMHRLPEALDAYAASLEIERLYDSDAALLYLSIDRDGVPHGHAEYFSDAALLLSICGAALGKLPPAHFTALRRTRVEAAGESFPLSENGDLAAYLLPGLFVPLDDRDARRIIWLHQHEGHHGLWGRSPSARFAFTPQMEYSQTPFGLHAIASGNPADDPVFAPYAAALALPFAPEAAMGCLHAMQQQGLFGPRGFFDALDCTGGNFHLVRMQDTFRQGLILASAAHVLAGAPLRRFFGELPIVQAVLPLLHTETAPVTLPQRPIFREAPDLCELPERSGDAAMTPLDAHLIGSRKANILMNAAGSSSLMADGLPLTPFTGDAHEAEGMQIYLVQDGHAYRITDPALPGQIRFSGGLIRSERLCAGLRVHLTVMTDPASGLILHLVEVANCASADCTFDMADFLPADLHAAPYMLEAARHGEYHLFLRDRGSGRTLHHRLSMTLPALQTAICTDSAGFLGRGRTALSPASLEEPMADLLPPGASDCLSFRVQFHLGGRAQTRLLFTTGLLDSQAPEWHELDSLMRLSVLHSRSVAAALPASPGDLMCASRMSGALFWRDQPHQGASVPVEAILPAPAFPGSSPILTVLLPDAASLPQLQECLTAAAWFSLHGRPVTLYVLCAEETADAAQAAIDASLHPEDRHAIRLIRGASDLLEASVCAMSALVIRGNGHSAASELDAHQSRIPAQPLSHPAPGTAPETAVVSSGGYGGFDPESGDYIVRLEAGQTTPVPWPVTLQSGHFAFSADETGLHFPFDERVLLAAGDSAPFEPLRCGLPLTMRVSNGSLRWRAFARDFTFTLDTACVPGHSAAVRTIRIRNLSDEPLTLTLTVSAAFAPDASDSLSPIGDLVLSTNGGFLAGGTEGWTCAAVPSIALPFARKGSYSAQLTVSLSAPPGSSAVAAWLCGHAAQADSIPLIQESLRMTGVSECIRSARYAAAEAVQGITVHTPEPTFDLLYNHVLPRQLLSAGLPVFSSAPADPAPLRQHLLHTVRNTPDGDFESLALTAVFLLLTGDTNVLAEPSGHGGTILDGCRKALRACCTAGLDGAGQPALLTAMLSAASGRELMRHTDDETIAAHTRRIVGELPSFLRQTAAPDENDTLYLDQLALAAILKPDSPRSRRALDACWTCLYDPQHGLIRQKLPVAGGACPGTVTNGGQITRSAVLFLSSLLCLNEPERAWELLRALNPMHHTDDPCRSERYTAAPWLIPAGLEAEPARAGRAVGTDDRAAALMQIIITAQILGLTRRNGRLHVQPCVPADWDSFSISLQLGASTWHISMERGLATPMQDGSPMKDTSFTPEDDGRIHQVRIPLA
ncbi:MAG: DUF3131 domain-containing protein [Clostridiales bacterium]|nr:DUF3131 domain-containing protein [Clostridiales bacterium]